MVESTLNSILLLVLGSIFSFLSAWFWFAKNAAIKRADELAAANERILARVTELEKREAVAASAMTPILTAVQAVLVNKLTHAHKPELDALLVKIGPPDVLTDEERQRLMSMLHDRSWEEDETIGRSERDAAVILPLLMPMVAS